MAITGQILPIGFILLGCLYISMKIEGSNKASGTKSTSKTKSGKGVGGDSFGSMVNSSSETSGEAHVSVSSPIGALDALLAVQEDGRGKSKSANEMAKQRANEILEQLDKVKMGLLRGELPKSTLQELSRTISAHRDSGVDAKLAAILDEIDLRAQVELAKLNQ